MNDKLYENYRRGIIERHICSNGRFLQDVLLNKETKEVVYVEEDGQKKLVGGGDNPFLYGGLMMAVFSIESMIGVSEYSLGYATELLNYFYKNHFTYFRRKKNWWREYKSLSKDELSGLILGLHFFIKANLLAPRNQFLTYSPIAVKILHDIAFYLHVNDWKPAGSWLFRYPFGQIFEHHIGGKHTKWYDKYIFRWTMRALPLVYQLASFFKIKRNFFNIAMYSHCLWMIYLTQKLPKGNISAYSKLHEFFCTEGWRPYQGQEAGNNYIELTQSMITYSEEPLTEHEWSEELPNCSVGGPQNDTIGECFTWEHPNSGNHNLEYEDWAKVLWRLGPSDKGQLDDMGKEFVVESCGLGLLFIRAMSYYNVMSDMPILENDNKFNTLPLEGPY